MKKRLLSLLLALVMVVSLLPMTALAAEVTEPLEAGKEEPKEKEQKLVYGTAGTITKELLGANEGKDADISLSTVTVVKKGTTTVESTITVELKNDSNKVNGTITTTAATPAGEYTVAITAKKGDGSAAFGTDGKKSVNIKVEKADNTWKVTPSIENVEYGEAVAPVGEATYNVGLKIEYEGRDWTRYDKSENKPTEIGKYEATFTVPESDNYKELEQKEVKFEITKPSAKLTQAPTANTLTYNGKAQKLVAGATAKNGTILYAVGDKAPQDADKWSANVPEATNAATYKVWYKVEGDANYENVAPNTTALEVKISKLAITITADDASKDYDGTELKCGTYKVTYEDGSACNVTGGVLPTGDTITVTMMPSSEITNYAKNGVANVIDPNFAIKSGTVNVTKNNYNVNTVNGTLTINKVKAIKTAPVVNPELTSDETTAQVLIKAGEVSVAADVKLKYALGTNATTAPTGAAWKDNVNEIKGKENTTYYVWYKAVVDSDAKKVNYSDLEGQTKETKPVCIEITKGNPIVTFDFMDAGKITTQQVALGGKATYIKAEREGSIFMGWYTEDGTLFSFSKTPITADITLTARWTMVADSTAKVLVKKDAHDANKDKYTTVNLTGDKGVMSRGLEDLALAMAAAKGSDKLAKGFPKKDVGTIDLSVKQTKNATADKKAAVKTKNSTVLFYDIDLTGTKGAADKKTADIAKADTVLEIMIPVPTNAKSVELYHCEETRGSVKATAFTEMTAQTAGEAGTFYVDRYGYLHLFANEFSTYAVAYTVPSSDSGTSTDTGSTTTTVKSAQTGDAGVLLYAGLAVSALMGTGYVSKKRKEF